MDSELKRIAEALEKIAAYIMAMSVSSPPLPTAPTVKETVDATKLLLDCHEDAKTDANTTATGHVLADIWNLHVVDPIPRVHSVSKTRLRKAKERWKENPSREYWVEVMKKIRQSSFCRGQNDRGWKANIDWLLRPDIHLKLMEGQYDNKTVGVVTYSSMVSPAEAERTRIQTEERLNTKTPNKVIEEIRAINRGEKRL